MRGIVILLVGSVVADYPYYTDYNSYNSVYAPTSSNISSRLQGIKRTWNPDGPFTFGLSNQVLKSIFKLLKHAKTNLIPSARYKPYRTVGRPGCQPQSLPPLLMDFQWRRKTRL